MTLFQPVSVRSKRPIVGERSRVSGDDQDCRDGPLGGHEDGLRRRLTKDGYGQL